MDWIEGPATIKKVQENILEVTEDGEESTEHTVTLICKNWSRKDFLRFVRAWKLGHLVTYTVAFTQAEMELDSTERQAAQAMAAFTQAAAEMDSTERLDAHPDAQEMASQAFWSPTGGDQSNESSDSQFHPVGPTTDEIPDNPWVSPAKDELN